MVFMEDPKEWAGPAPAVAGQVAGQLPGQLPGQGERSASGVITRVSGGTGMIALDRPRALNALDLPMVTAMTEVLRRWRDDPAVRSVLVRSTSPKAFCAGGDIRAVRE